MTYDNNENRTLDMPDIALPFFAYGIFKPGQLAYSKIRNHVYKTEDVEIKYGMRIRDGVPILIDDEKDYFRTNGVIMTFRQGQEEQSYRIISKTLLAKLYEWKVIEIDGVYVNVVFGVNPKKGSNFIEDSRQRVSYDGKENPLFSDALDLIERSLNQERNPYRIESFFELQMSFMMLWSAINRFSSLKYNQKFEIENYKKFARQKSFRHSIKQFEDRRHEPIYSTDDLEIHEFDAEDPIKTLFYYYTFRCNVVHRGKTAGEDYDKVEQATRELLLIFGNVLSDAFAES